MSYACLIFPHQLYAEHPALRKGSPVYLVEEYLYFRQYPFHQAKLVLHRASMKAYASTLRKKGYSVHYIESAQPNSDLRKLIPSLHKEGTRRIGCCDPTDEWLIKRLRSGCAAKGIECQVLPSPNFICTPDEPIAGRKQPMYFQTDFYIRQRKKQGWLMDKNGKPEGGQWSFDADNRKPLPKGLPIPATPSMPLNAERTEAIAYVKKNFADHYGSADAFYFPTTREEALNWLEAFLRHRFNGFGDYEDAMHPDEPFLFHSGLTPMLNIGLLDPGEVVAQTLAFANKNKVPLATTEGFIRQVTGWREFIRLVYCQAGTRQRTSHFWGFKRKIPESFWTGQTGIVPVDAVIRKLLQTGYSHHIERLMVLGNFMLLCEFDPDEVYRWFMTLYIDAYDWVMVPNVYGMTQFADGGLMTTKPYISGSNYLMKMGKWEKGDWQAIWDGLFWRFLSTHRSFFSQNPRLGMLLKSWDKMDSAKKEAHLRNANGFLKKLDA